MSTKEASASAHKDNPVQSEAGRRHCTAPDLQVAPGALIKCGTCAVHRSCTQTACELGREYVDAAGVVFGMGGEDSVRSRGSVQPDELSQRLGLAARECDDRGGFRTLWLQGGRDQDLQRAL